MAGQPDVELNSTVMRRQRQLEAQLAELGREGLDDRLRLASDTPLSPPHRLDQLIQDAAGKLVVVCEVRRASPAHPPKLLGELAAAYERAGADALAVRTDVEDTPTGTADIFAVVRSTQLPVLRTDYYLHPLQARLPPPPGCLVPAWPAAAPTLQLPCGCPAHDRRALPPDELPRCARSACRLSTPRSRVRRAW